MKHSDIEHVVVDEAHQRTYIVLSQQALTDGEIYSRIRKALLQRGGQPLERGETLRIARTGASSIATAPTSAEGPSKIDL